MAAFARMDRKEGRTVSQTAKVPAKTRTKAAPKANQPTTVDSARAIASEYPFALLLGGLALGVVAGALLPRAAGRRLTKGAVAAASIAGELGLLYGRQALEKAGDAAGSLDGLKETVGANAADYSRKAADLVGDAGRKAAEAASEAFAATRDASHKIGKQAIRLRSHLRH